MEFLIKNGSERVIDDARSHVPLLKMLRQFHYIDPNGKDQGINVRNRAKELADLLGDVDRIRTERKKSRANRNKFGGVEGGAGSSLSGGSRYGGFSSDEYGGYSGGVYGDGGGFGGRESGFQDTQNRRDRFEEYDEYDEGATASSRRKPEVSTSSQAQVKKAEPPKPKEPEIDLLEDIPPETPPKEFAGSSALNGKKPAMSSFDEGFGSMQSANAGGDDDFDDFQSATPTTTNTTATTSTAPSSIPGLPPPMTTSIPSQNTQFAAPRPTAPVGPTGFAVASPAPSSSGVSSPPAPNYNISMSEPLASFSPPPVQQQTAKPAFQQATPSGYQPSTPNYFTSVQAPAQSSTPASTGGRPAPASTSSFSKPAPRPSASGGDAFGNIWSSASSGAGIKKTTTASSSGPNLASLQREKATQGLWGMGSSQASTPQSQTPQPAMGAPATFGNANGQKSGGGGALDDLLG